MSECSLCECATDEAVSTYCGSFCPSCYQEHLEDCEICRGEEDDSYTSIAKKVLGIDSPTKQDRESIKGSILSAMYKLSE